MGHEASCVLKLKCEGERLPGEGQAIGLGLSCTDGRQEDVFRSSDRKLCHLLLTDIVLASPRVSTH